MSKKTKITLPHDGDYLKHSAEIPPMIPPKIIPKKTEPVKPSNDKKGDS